MRKLTSILFCLCLLFVSGSFAQNQNAEPSKTEKSEDGFACDLPPSVTSVELSQTKIFLNCPKSDESCSENKIINIRTVAMDNGDVEYKYIVSAGKIVGEGANVKWDLTDVKAGTYTISAGVGIPVWGVVGQTKTEVVTVLECPDCKPLDTQVNNFTGVPPGFVTSSDSTSWIISGGFSRKKRQNEVPNLVPNVTSLILSRAEIAANCAANSNLCKDEKRTIEIFTEAVDPENDVLTYEYTVSGGNIIGQGAKVVWDLSGVTPGTYTITVGANDGCGICGKTWTEQVKVIDCPDCKK